jgi:hypothetical protein
VWSARAQPRLPVSRNVPVLWSWSSAFVEDATLPPIPPRSAVGRAVNPSAGANPVDDE